MIAKVKSYIKGLLYENNEPSRTGFLALLAFLSFLLGSAYLMVKNQQWAHYDTFASITGGGGAITQVVNKYINSKLNSPAEQPFIKNNGGA